MDYADQDYAQAMSTRAPRQLRELMRSAVHGYKETLQTAHTNLNSNAAKSVNKDINVKDRNVRLLMVCESTSSVCESTSSVCEFTSCVCESTSSVLKITSSVSRRVKQNTSQCNMELL
jgi:Mg2+/Co2+ transporter CorC